ncbi:MAG: shikimate kinase [Clostridia bacterium]|nr:shikimate kinase [Clostridia bacterium]
MGRKSIVLCGFMGCGKSTIGSLLARKMGMAFVDMDSYIEKKEGKSVSEIFAQSGEEHFRMLEREAAKELAGKKGLVIATGGGTLTFRENVDTLRKSGSIVLLDLPVEAVEERLKYDTTRPLLARPDKSEVIRELYNKRLPLYREAADISVDASNSPMQVCMEIMSEL